MLFDNDRNQMRRCFREVWRKQAAGLPLEPLEHLIAGVIGQHLEYQALLTGPEVLLEQEYFPEMGATNPFLHMGMHIAIQEQLTSDRPTGIMQIYRWLCQHVGDNHTAEHRMMACLGETL